MTAGMAAWVRAAPGVDTDGDLITHRPTLNLPKKKPRSRGMSGAQSVLANLEDPSPDRQTTLRHPRYTGQLSKVLGKRSGGDGHLHADCISTPKPESVSNVSLVIKLVIGEHGLHHQERHDIPGPDRKPEKTTNGERR